MVIDLMRISTAPVLSVMCSPVICGAVSQLPDPDSVVAVRPFFFNDWFKT